MTFSATEQFASKPVKEWVVGSPLPDTASYAVKLAIHPYEDEDIADFNTYFEAFLKLPGIEKIDTLILGCWGEAYDENSSLAVNLLVKNKDKFPLLTALFIGDLTLEEAEVSWIQQSDISSVYPAFPRLELLKIRGGEGLSLGNISHERLQTLVIETGGLDKSILEQARLANLPALSHLELWLGDENYGCTIGADELRAFMTGLSQQFTQLSYLGLRNYYLMDDLAKVISQSDIPVTLTTLDLSLGSLSDSGAAALLASDKFKSLQTLDLHYHYLSTDMMNQLAAAKLAQNVILDDQNEPDEYDGELYRYIYVSE